MKTILLSVLLIGFVVAQETKMDSLLTVKMAELQTRWEVFEVEQAKIAYAHTEFAKFQQSLKPKEVEEPDTTEDKDGSE